MLSNGPFHGLHVTIDFFPFVIIGNFIICQTWAKGIKSQDRRTKSQYLLFVLSHDLTGHLAAKKIVAGVRIQLFKHNGLNRYSNQLIDYILSAVATFDL